MNAILAFAVYVLCSVALGVVLATTAPHWPDEDDTNS
jgi:hypothetical protein